MTDRELMQRALDALEGYARNCRCEGGGAPCDAAEALRARLEKWTADDTAYRPDGLPQEEQELVAWSRVNMNDHKEGDLGIGTVKWDASAPLVVHPHPAFQTIEALRARLAQPEQKHSEQWWRHEVSNAYANGYEKGRASVKQPEPEPWGYISHKSWKMPVFVEADDLQAANLPFNNPDYTPVYKAPPQREWQGLTDDEVNNFAAGCHLGKSVQGAIYEAAAKLREKNHAI